MISEKLTYEQIVEWIKIFKNEYEEYPFEGEQRNIKEQNGLSWKLINKSLRRGYRSLPGNYSLSKLITEYFNEKPRVRQSKLKLTEDIIVSLMKDYFDEYGKYPNCSSKEEIAEYPGKSWEDIHVHLYNGKVKGLIGIKSGLAHLASKHFGEENWSNWPELTITLIVDWLEKFNNIYEYYPAANEEKEVPDAPSCVTWTKIHKALYHGFLGFPGGSSLAKIKEEYLGQINKSNLPSLTEEEIALAMYKFNDLYGYYPSVGEKFAVPGHPNDTWCGFTAALNQGKRGLGKENKGNSLALVSEKYFGRRNQGNLPDLKLEDILNSISEFHKENKFYPTSKYNDFSVPNMPTETWRSLNYALRHGARGLNNIKENSLIKLAEKYFNYKPYSNYYNENLCRQIIEELTGEEFPSSDKLNLSWLVNEKGNKLQIDGVNLKLNLAFEHQGVQHYMFNEKFHNNNEAEFFRQIQVDAIKLKLCNEQNIKLICIYQNEPDKRKFIKEKLIELGFNIISE